MKVCETLDLDDITNDMDMHDAMMDDELYVEMEEMFMTRLT
jgi:hypothetical protein